MDAQRDDDPSTFYAVHFHSDDGPGKCSEGVRCMTDELVALGLNDILSHEPGHRCRDSVWTERSDTPQWNNGSFQVSEYHRCRQTRWVRRLHLYCETNQIPLSATTFVSKPMGRKPKKEEMDARRGHARHDREESLRRLRQTN